jgi:hypothetical protein
LQHFLLEIGVRDLARCASHAGILLAMNPLIGGKTTSGT